MISNIIITSKSIINVPLQEITLLAQLYDARLDVKNEELIFEEIIINENEYR